MEGSRYYYESFKKKRGLTCATINIVGRGKPILGVANLNLSSDGHFSTEDDGVYCHIQSRTMSAEVNRSTSPPHYELQEEEDILIDILHMPNLRHQIYLTKEVFLLILSGMTWAVSSRVENCSS